MKKLMTILILSLFIAVPVFGIVKVAKAANDVTIDVDMTLALSNMNLTLKSGSSFSSATIQTDTIEFTISAGGNVKLVSSDRYTLTNSKSIEIVCASNFSMVHYAVPAGESDQTITFTPTTSTCVGSGSSAGTSGGGAAGTTGGAGTETAAPAGTLSTNKTVSGTNGGAVATTDNRAGVTVPEGLVTGNVSMNITPEASADYGSPTTNYSAVASQVYNFSLSSAGEELTQFSKKVTLSFEYTNADIISLDEDSLKVYYWDIENNKWVLVGGTVDKDNNIVTVEVDHFTVFGVFGKQTGVAVQVKGGDLITLQCPSGADVNHACKSVYYLGSDGKRYVFPNETTYFTWYSDFSSVKTVTGEVMASYSIGGNVTVRPGTYLVKITTDPKVYAVEPCGVLHWVQSEESAQNLYGNNWIKRIVDVPDAFFVNYDASKSIDNPVIDKHPIGTLIKYAGLPNVYYVGSGGIKRLFATNTVLITNRFRNEFIIETDITYNDGATIAGAETSFVSTAGP